ncbi:unnamed protein product [Parascedosporium putredinis]|uniref:Uncharacterized protein n=1 Tax=Parascedosporium putredinis TaxID=1442378 RepID=A0A9P1H4A6_9PEZI|nr:unnamed protein product [Parascedosporium putredinis]CAI7996463.1 unnamed protein product [Parascedosporium putredinis]
MSSTESPILRPFTYADSFNHVGSASRSSSMSASVNFGPTRRTSKGPSHLATDPITPAGGLFGFPSSAHSRKASTGLWSPVRDEYEDDYFPDFDNKRRQTTTLLHNSGLALQEQQREQEVVAVVVDFGQHLGQSLGDAGL